jgi:hypothetical protein
MDMRNAKVTISWIDGLGEHLKVAVDPITALSLANTFNAANQRANFDISSMAGRTKILDNKEHQRLARTLRLYVAKYRALKDQPALDELRRQVIEDAWLGATLIDGDEGFEDSDGWEHTYPSDEYSRLYYVEHSMDGEKGRRRFVVRFKPDSKEIAETVIYDCASGNVLDIDPDI